MGYEFHFDSIGWTYMGLTIAWNVALVAGMIFLWIHRQQPSLRMRKLPLMFAGILCLHMYGLLCIVIYPIGAIFSCTLEFWIMSIYLPLGIALFHAANTQFLHLASRQKNFARMSSLSSMSNHKSINEEKAREVSNSRWKRIVAGVERADNIERTLVFIGVGLAVQLALTLFVFFGSEKFHPGYGLFDYTVVGTGKEVRQSCSKGWEWWLSIVWQLFWSWIYAPYVLWKSRGIRDVHGWRLQTICCCLAGLPASPLWLAGLYAPQFATLNAVLPPPVWFSICIFFMEVFAIAFPIVDVLKGNSLRQETLEAIRSWEIRNAQNGLDGNGSMKSPSALSNTTTLNSSGGATFDGKQSFESRKSDVLTMTALENALRTNAIPLLEFAALKDFSGENVSFLTHVADWRRYWFAPKASTAEHHRKQFIAATRIYAHFISLEFSEFPINISSKEMKRLHKVFARSASLLYRSNRGSMSSSTSDDATPFDSVLPDEVPESPVDSKSPFGSTTELKSLDALGRANLKAVSGMQELYTDELFSDIDIPDSFNEMVFDPAESEIKYLVLTNTWPKFVNIGRANSQMSRDAEDEEKGNVWIRKILC
ncbi:Nn.00g044920.m01.CDS01 [Neocucurbitaria sp. VM-36]